MLDKLGEKTEEKLIWSLNVEILILPNTDYKLYDTERRK